MSYKSRKGILVRLSAMWKTKRHYCAVRMVSISCVLNFCFNSKDNCTMLLTSFEVFRCSIARPRYKDFELKYNFFVYNLLRGEIKMISKNTFTCTPKTRFSFYHLTWLRVFNVFLRGVARGGPGVPVTPPW